MKSILLFISIMWVLLISGGGIVVGLLGPISISGYDNFVASAIKAIIAIVLVIVWILILTIMKKLIFSKQVKG